MRETFLYQMYTNLANIHPTYRRVKIIQVLMISKEVFKSLATKKGNDILIWRWNDYVAHWP